MLSCGQVKTELFKNADIKASICDLPEHAHGSLGITRGHFACLFSCIEAQTAEFESSCVFMCTGIFSKTLLVWTRIFFYTDKKDAFSKRSRYVWTGPKATIPLPHLSILTFLFPLFCSLWKKLYEIVAPSTPFNFTNLLFIAFCSPNLPVAACTIVCRCPFRPHNRGGWYLKYGKNDTQCQSPRVGWIQ